MKSSVLSAPRVRNGKPTTTEISVTYQDTGKDLPVLHLFSDGWSNRKADFREKNLYTVEEINTGMDGRAFILHRDPEAIKADSYRNDGSEPDTRYGVLIARNGQDDLCECRGFIAHGRCKHVLALRGLIEGGHIDRPGDDAPVTIFPTPEQVDHDAKRVDSLPEGFDPFGPCTSETDAELYVGASYKPGHDSDLAF